MILLLVMEYIWSAGRLFGRPPYWEGCSKEWVKKREARWVHMWEAKILYMEVRREMGL